MSEEARDEYNELRAAADEAYLARYLERSEVVLEDVSQWMRPLAAARLREMQPNGPGVCDYAALHAVATGELDIFADRYHY